VLRARNKKGTWILHKEGTWILANKGTWILDELRGPGFLENEEEDPNSVRLSWTTGS
jgi:hypothetical protein